MLYWRDWNLRLSYFDYSDDKMFFFFHINHYYLFLYIFSRIHLPTYCAMSNIYTHSMFCCLCSRREEVGARKNSRPYSQRGKKQRHKAVFNFNLSSFFPSAFFQHVFVYKSIYEYGCSVMYLQMFIFTFHALTILESFVLWMNENL
jgi:hypothetical protein